MDLSKRFKTDYLNYLISIIIPAVINAVSIPLFKRILGAAHYGNFSITYNSSLLFTALFAGWIMQSIIRYFPTVQDKKAFANAALRISFKIQLVIFFPVLLCIYYFNNDFILSLLFSAVLFITSMQFSMSAISQSAFLSRKSIYSEVVRTVSYIVLAVILLLKTKIDYMYSLFIAIFISYMLSFTYLYFQSSKALILQNSLQQNLPQSKNMLKTFLLYGAPLSLWFVFFYLISLVDKYFILYNHGEEKQGNYQAIFDFLSKSITVIISPVVISLFPLLTAAYQAEKKNEIRKLMKTILGFELAGLFIASLAYWWFGAGILFKLIKTPDTFEYKLMGQFIIIGTFLWQIAIVIHKWYELKFKSSTLMLMISIAFVFQILFYLIMGKNKNILLYPAGYILASVIYLFLISFQFLPNGKSRNFSAR